MSKRDEPIPHLGTVLTYLAVGASSSFTLQILRFPELSLREQTPRPTYTGSFKGTYSTGPAAFNSSFGFPAYIVKRLPCLTIRNRAVPST